VELFDHDECTYSSFNSQCQPLIAIFYTFLTFGVLDNREVFLFYLYMGVGFAFALELVDERDDFEAD